jgi:hypothetical protein
VSICYEGCIALFIGLCFGALARGLQVADCGCLATVSCDRACTHPVVASLVATDAPFTLLFFFFLHASLLAHQVDRSTAEDTRQTRHLDGKQGKKSRPAGLATSYKVSYECSPLWRDIASTRQLTKHSNASQHIGNIPGLHSSLSDCT